MFIDTHAHLWFDDYKDDLEDVLARAKAAGVEKMIVPGTNVETSKQAVELAKKYPRTIYAAVGVHPEELLNRNLQNSNEETPPTFGVPTRPLAGSPVEESPLGLRALITGSREQIVAIGEIGTDASTAELKNCMGEQKELFREQCEIALEYNLPVIIHTRNSLREALEVLDSLKEMPRGQFHCFSHDEDGVKQVLTRGFCISFCGNITWSKRVARLVSLIPEDRLLLETDSPLMVPRDKKGNPVQWIAKVPNSGPESLPAQAGSEPESRRNEPMNVTILAQLIADLRGDSLKALADQTTENAKTLFRL